MIDVHCHLNFHSFAKDYDTVIKEAFEAGVTTIINVGTKIDSSQKAVELASKYDNLYAIVGVHPHHADKPLFRHSGKLKAHPESTDAETDSGQARMTNKNWLTELEVLAKQPKVVAIGEIGLDNYRYQSNGIVDPKVQREVFEAQIELAHEANLPIQIHNRHAGKDILRILEEKRTYLLQNVPGMFHCLAGDKDVLKKALNLGFYIGFDGNITYKGLAPGETTTLPELANITPLNRIVIETDSPFLTPEPHRGSRNEPQYAIIIAKFLANLKNIPLDQVLEQTTINTQAIFPKLNL